jgi:hypothetical protein
MKFRVFWDVASCSQVQVDQRFRGAYCLHHQAMMEAVCTSEMLVNFNMTTRCNIPEDSKLDFKWFIYLEDLTLLCVKCFYWLLRFPEIKL